METDNHEEPKREQVPSVSDDPEFTYRVYSVLSYFIVLVVIGLPVWWYTTRVYRADLPLDRMNEDFPNRTENKQQFGVPLSLEYDVLITMVHPHPETLKVDLDGHLLDSHLQPYLEKISSVADFVVKSQWLYLVDLGVLAHGKSDGAHLVPVEQLPHLITLLEKKLWSHISERPCINLVVYVASCDTPTYILNGLGERSTTNAFISPRWGGISILNPDQESCKSGTYKPDLNHLTSVFVSQLNRLLKIQGTEDEDLLALKKSRAESMVDSTRRTLRSLAQLLSEISSIVISDEVAHKIHVAVENADAAEDYLKSGDVDRALEHAKKAFDNSEVAFSDPSLLALLYFPEDQKYAVYIPLFLPVMIPVLMSLITVRKWFYCAEKTKNKID